MTQRAFEPTYDRLWQQETNQSVAAGGNEKAACIGSLAPLASFHIGVHCRASTQRGSACQQRANLRTVSACSSGFDGNKKLLWNLNQDQRTQCLTKTPLLNDASILACAHGRRRSIKRKGNMVVVFSWAAVGPGSPSNIIPTSEKKNHKASTSAMRRAGFQ